MNIIAILTSIGGLFLALADVLAARTLPSDSRFRNFMQRAATIVVALNLLLGLTLFAFNPSENPIVWFGAIIVAVGALTAALMALGLLTGIAKTWDGSTKGWLLLSLLASLIVLILAVVNIIGGQVWYAAIGSGGLMFAAALLTFICIAKRGPEIENINNQRIGTQS